MYSPSSERSPRSAFSGRILPGSVSHFGPPTAPSRTESLARHPSRVSCGSGVCDELAISDAPSLSHRGFLIDSCRHFYGVEELKRLIDVAAAFKLNQFHWHLTDDQGWRIEIKGPPASIIAWMKGGCGFA